MAEPSYLTETRAGYDAIAIDYAERFVGELARRPLDRAILTAFADVVAGKFPVADIGSGPGEVAAFLSELGVDVFGVDLSPVMVAIASRSNPGLRFVEGTMTALDIPDASLGGIVAWYSIIHVPPEELPRVFAEFARVLVPGGWLLVGFQMGDEVVHYDEGFGHRISLDFRRLRPDRIAGLLGDAGFVIEAQLDRRAEDWEKDPQSRLLARLGDR